MKPLKSFDQSYADAAAQVFQQDFLAKSERLGALRENAALTIPFFNRDLVLEKDRISDRSGQDVSLALKVMLCRYVLLCPEKPPTRSGELISFRELKGSGPLTSYFTSNTNKTIETTFSGRLPMLEGQCDTLKGMKQTCSGYDLSIRFPALPNIPVILSMNDADDMMPASSIFLFESSVQEFLDLESLIILTTYLTGQLIKF